MARTAQEYLWLVMALDPDKGLVWLRQGDPEALGVAPGDAPMDFARWNAILNRLGGQGWDIVSTNNLGGDASNEQLWLLRRELE